MNFKTWCGSGRYFFLFFYFWFSTLMLMILNEFFPYLTNIYIYILQSDWRRIYSLSSYLCWYVAQSGWNWWYNGGNYLYIKNVLSIKEMHKWVVVIMLAQWHMCNFFWPGTHVIWVGKLILVAPHYFKSFVRVKSC